MDQEQLIELLKAHEWRDVEFKEAQRDVPRNAYETVSAFANTAGGHLVFGVKKEGGEVEIVGVLDVDKVQGDFLSTLRQPDKISMILDVEESLHKHDDTHLLVFYVPEAQRTEKPVYLNGDIRRTFIRRGGCDVRCSEDERNRFLIDAAAERYDSQSIDLSLDTCFNGNSIKWYRNNYEGRAGNRSYAELSDRDFLAQMGLLVEQVGQLKPSRAAILLFGTDAALRQLVPKPVVDCQKFSLTRDKAETGERWADRLIVEENLVTAWQALVSWYEKLTERPFRIDPNSLQRDDTPPDYRAFREAIVNLLIHQDYADHTRKAEIRHYPDQTVFWNPGDAFATDADLLEPGEKEVRNPRIVTAFRRIGLSEHAGWGLRDVFRNWQGLGYVPPHLTNNKGRKSFELVLQREELLSEQQLLFQASLGVRLTDEQARVFAVATRQDEISLSEIKTITGLSSPDAQHLAETLVTQVLLFRLESRTCFALAEHLRDRFLQEPADLVTDQVPDVQKDMVTVQVDGEGQDLSTAQVDKKASDLSTTQVKPLTQLTEVQWKIIALCDVPRRLAELMEKLDISSRGYFKAHHLDPLIAGEVIRMTNPDKPRASNQRYVLTEAGAALKARRLGTKKSNEE
jgi:ATP-dependent DNA helicase RecG